MIKQIFRMSTLGMVLLFLGSWEISLSVEDQTYSQNSSASVSFLPNPKLPLKPNDLDSIVNPKTSEVAHASDNNSSTNYMSVSGELPQTGERKQTPIIGFGILITAIIIWYSRRKLLNNKKTNTMEEK